MSIMDNLTKRLEKAVGTGATNALHADHTAVTSVHVLAALAADAHSELNAVARHCGLERDELARALGGHLAQLPTVKGEHTGDILPARDFQRVLNLSSKTAQQRQQSHVSTGIFVETAVKHDPAVAKVFKSFGLDAAQVTAAVEAISKGLAAGGDATGNPASAALDQFTIDLTAKARAGDLDPVIGRDDEIRRAMQILQRRTKNNPVLIGEPGVGKTAIVDGLAQRIAAGEVPAGLRDRRVLALDVAALVAGTSRRGEFEERLKQVMQGIAQNRDSVVIFIDEIHILVGAGTAEGSMDAANMLKPALARGEMHCIGATTLNEYRKHIEKDPALERRFQRLLVQEPDATAAVSILRGLADRYISHHGVHITDPAIVAAVELSNRYVTDRFLPDKAIDLIDEAAAKLRIEQDSKPEELDRLDRVLSQLKMDEQAVQRETDESSQKRLAEIQERIKTTEKEIASLTEVWRSERAAQDSIQDNKKRQDEAKRQIEEASAKGDYEEAGRLKHVVLKELQDAEAELAVAAERKLLPLEVGETEIAEVVARATGVPMSRLLGTERDRLLGMAAHLKDRVINQDAAVDVVTAAVQRARTGLADPQRPNGTFMFLGATGVGKTELAKALAEFLFASERHLVRIDMSEYMERHAVARLIGAPPGYIGHDEGGQLTEAVRRRPYSVILLDEIEKAHSEVLNVFLQVLDDGRLTDSQGRTVDFRNTVLVMTSNVGATHLAGTVGEEARARALAEVHDRFTPEFLNRLDEIVVFNGLDRPAIKLIAAVQLKRLRERLRGEGQDLDWDDKALTLLSHRGHDAVFGARPLKRQLQLAVETPIAQAMLAGQCGPGVKVVVSAGDGEFRFEYAKDSPAAA